MLYKHNYIRSEIVLFQQFTKITKQKLDIMSEGIVKKTESEGPGDAGPKGKGQQGPSKFHPRKTKAAGAYEELENCIFDVADGKQIEKFANNLKVIATYVGQKYTGGGDIRYTIEKMELYDIEEPPPSGTNPSEFKKEVWKRQVADYVRRFNQLRTNVRLAYSLVWGQCTIAMQEKISTHEKFKDLEKQYDVIELLKIIQNTVFQFEERKDSALALMKATKRLYGHFQHKEMSLMAHNFLMSQSFLLRLLGQHTSAVEESLLERIE